MKRLLIIVAAVAVLALGVATVVGATTSAQEGDGPMGTFLAKVADKLGVSEDELKTAIKDARLETIDEAVDEGRITEEQAERLKERVEEGAGLFPRRPHHRPGVGLVVGSAAQVLEMEKAELVEELKSGKSLAEVAEAQGMSVEEFKSALLEQVGADLEEQTDRIFQGLEENIDRIVNAHGIPGPGHCRPGPGHRLFRPHGGHQGSPVPSETSSELTL